MQEVSNMNNFINELHEEPGQKEQFRDNIRRSDTLLKASGKVSSNYFEVGAPMIHRIKSPTKTGGLGK